MTDQEGGLFAGGAVPIWQNSNLRSLLNVLFLGDGYLDSQRALFVDDCTVLSDTIKAENWYSPLLRYSLYRQDVWSNQEGAATAATCGPGGDRQTYFDATYGGGGGLCRILEGNDKTAKAAAAKAATAAGLANGFRFNRIVVLVNSDRYGGSCGGAMTWVPARNAVFKGLFLHELGHVMELADEYSYYTGCGDAFRRGGAWRPVAHNIDNRHTATRWETKRNKMPGATISSADCTVCIDEARLAGFVDTDVGAFQGGGWYRCGIYRPSAQCRMKNSTHEGFCRICVEHIIDYLT